MTSQFYLTLPSNSDAANTASTFTTKLPRQIVLTGEWEVGLAEIIYANTWHNVKDEENTVKFYDIDHNTRHTILIPRARYQTVDDLTKAIYDGIKVVADKDKVDYNAYLEIKFDDTKKRCTLRIDSVKIRSVKLSNHLMYMLGFLKHQLIDINYNAGLKFLIPARHSPDMLGGMHSFYVYCDIVEPQIVGNVFAPLLQVINIEGKYMDIINHAYISPHYIPVLKKSFNTIDIAVKTDQDEPVPFEFGKTIVKLHFKRVLN